MLQYHTYSYSSPDALHPVASLLWPAVPWQQTTLNHTHCIDLRGIHVQYMSLPSSSYSLLLLSLSLPPSSYSRSLSLSPLTLALSPSLPLSLLKCFNTALECYTSSRTHRLQGETARSCRGFPINAHPSFHLCTHNRLHSSSVSSYFSSALTILLSFTKTFSCPGAAHFT